MLFSSKTFLFIFLPTVIGIYYLFLRKHTKIKNLFLFLVSLLFYAWSEPKFLIVMLILILLNWISGIIIEKNRNISKIVLCITLLFDIGVIFLYKYLGFIVENINMIIKPIGWEIANIEFVLPLGISFFTFQAISYIIDVFKGKVKAQRNFINLGLYISFFPQLIAGPIVRYDTIEKQINNRKENFDDFSSGVCRFIIGLGKKVIIANNIAIVADKAFELQNPSICMAWLGIIAYTLQIFFDFSGYSDMAIGLGKMFGFHFLENFNYPYVAKSISDFWRRWHISLETWFKDYVYIPLGGNRVTKRRMVFNIFIVWLLTGLWHGANWTFILWGIMYFILLTIEKLTKFDKKAGKLKVINHVYSLLFIMIGWVLFRSDNIFQAFTYLGGMFGLQHNLFIDNVAKVYFKEFWIYFILGIIFCLPFTKKIYEKLRDNKVFQFLLIIFAIMILVLSISYINENIYNPFIYFNF